MKININGISKITKPIFDQDLTQYSNIFTNTQHEIVTDILSSDETVFFTIKSGRQSGKTEICLKIVVYLLLKSKSRFLIVTPDFSAIRDTIFPRIVNMKGLKPFIEKSKTSPVPQVIFKNGSEIVFKSAENKKAIRSGTYDYVWFDEFAFVENGILTEEVLPVLTTASNPKVIMSSTPFGRSNDFFDYYQKGKTDDITYKSYDMLWTANPKSKEFIVLTAKKDSADIKFKQEWLGEFVEGEGSVFKNMDEYCILSSYPDFLPEHIYYAGVDWGRTNDSTVLTIFNNFGQVVCKYKRTKASWEILTEEISLILHKFNQYKVCYCLAEDNGIGSGPVEMLTRKYPNVIPFNTNSSTKNPMIERLIVSINNKQVQLPTKELDKDLFQQMESFEISLNPVSRAFHYAARKGCHDDDVLSLALANYCRTEYGSKGQLKGYSKYVNPNRF